MSRASDDEPASHRVQSGERASAARPGFGLGMLAVALGAVASGAVDGLLAISRSPTGALSARASLAVLEHSIALGLAPALWLGLAAEPFVASASRMPRVRAAGRWLASGPRTWFRADATAALGTALVVLFASVVLAPIYPTALFVGTSFHSRPLAALAVFVALLGSIGAAGLLCALLAAPLGWLARRAGRAASPGTVLALAIVGALALLARSAHHSRHLTEPTFDASVFAPPIMLVLMASAAFLVAERRRRFAWVAALVVLAAEVGLPVASARTLGRDPVAARALVERAPVAGAIASVIQEASDEDRDGYGALGGGGDCNDRDRAVHPGAFDEPGNGRDEDCSGRDAVRRPPPPEPSGEGARLRTERGLEQPSIVLITVEGLEPTVGCAAPAPSLAGFVRRAACFSRAYAAADRVGFAIGALYTGRYAGALPWTADGGAVSLPLDVPTAAERLLGHGYLTASFASDDALAQHTALRQGFVELHDGHGTTADLDRTVRLAVAFLGDRAGDRRASLLHVHLHGGADDARVLRALATVVDAAHALEAVRPVITLVTGASARMPSRAAEGGALREAQARVPLWIAGASIAPGERPAPCSLLDLGPTLLELAGSPSPAPSDGRSLLASLLDARLARTTDDRALVVEGFATDGSTRASAYGWLESGHELIAVPGAVDWALYDLSRDPGERSNRFDPSTEPSRTLREHLASYVAYAVQRAMPLGALRLGARAPARTAADKPPLDLHFAGALELMTASVPTTPVVPGGLLPMTLEYKALVRTQSPLWFQVSFEPITPGAGPLPTVRRWPLDGRDPTNAWAWGDTRRETLTVVVPADARPGRLRARFSLLSDPDLTTVRPEMGADSTGAVVMGEVVVAGRAR